MCRVVDRLFWGLCAFGVGGRRVGTRTERQRFVAGRPFLTGETLCFDARTLLAALTLLFAAPLPGNAQQKKVPPAQQSDARLVGLPLYSSDGEKLGEVTQIVTAAGQRAVRAEMGAFLGL